MLEKLKLEIEESVYHWWRWRYAQLAQDLVGKSDKCPTLMNIFLEASNIIEHSNILVEKSTHELFLAEFIQSALIYYKYEEAIDGMKTLENLHEVQYSLSGALGRRTKHQKFSCPQLYVKVEMGDPTFGVYDRCYGEEVDIVNHILEDENKLDYVKFDDEGVVNLSNISTIGNTIGFIKMAVLMQTGPTKDRLNEEEQLTYIDFILSNKSVTPCVVFEALRLRSKLEVYKFAQAHRGMKQIQSLVAMVTQESAVSFSLQHFFASKMLPIWELRRMLCQTFVKMGCTKSALEEYLGNIFTINF